MGLLDAAVKVAKSTASSAMDFFGEVGDYFGGAVGAVTQTALTGAATGVLVGAVTNLIRGEDLLEGALYGAAIGGIGAGLLEGVNQYAFDEPLWDIDNLQASFKNISESAPPASEADPYGYGGPGVGDTGYDNRKVMGSLAVKAGQSTSDEKSKLYAGILKGGADAYGSYVEGENAKDIAKMNKKAQLEILQKTHDLKQEAIAQNKPGIVAKPSAAIVRRSDITKNLDGWWQDRMSPRLTA